MFLLEIHDYIVYAYRQTTIRRYQHAYDHTAIKIVEN